MTPLEQPIEPVLTDDAAQWTIALHEAGHTVARWALGRPVAMVSIERDGRGTTRPLGPLAPTIEDFLDDVRQLPPAARQPQLAAELLIKFAGSAADHLDRGLMEWDGEQDRQVVALAFAAFGHHAALPGLFTSIQRRMQDPPVWTAVRALATALIDRRHLSEAAIADVVSPHLPYGYWTLEEKAP